MYVLGLALATHGGNRTGRVFTGDRSGDWLYGALHTLGFANQPTAVHREDGLTLSSSYVAAAVRCAPPDNKPTKDEFETCRPFVQEELQLLQKVRVAVALGKIVFDEYLRTCKMAGQAVASPRPKFSQGAKNLLPWNITLLGSYHPSQQNMFTGKLTCPMFHQAFSRTKNLVDEF